MAQVSIIATYLCKARNMRFKKMTRSFLWMGWCGGYNTAQVRYIHTLFWTKITLCSAAASFWEHNFAIVELDFLTLLFPFFQIHPTLCLPARIKQEWLWACRVQFNVLHFLVGGVFDYKCTQKRSKMRTTRRGGGRKKYKSASTHTYLLTYHFGAPFM